MNNSIPTPNIDPVYRIVVHGQLDEKWATWLNDMLVKQINSCRNSLDTSVIIMVPDQAALRGVVNKIWDLNLTIKSIQSVEKE